MDNNLGKKAETKIREWLDKQDQGYCFERIPDQLTGFYGSRNICDFYLYVWPNMYYIESMTKKDIAAGLNISATHVARIIKRALNKMYIIMTKDNKED